MIEENVGDTAFKHNTTSQEMGGLMCLNCPSPKHLTSGW